MEKQLNMGGNLLRESLIMKEESSRRGAVEQSGRRTQSLEDRHRPLEDGLAGGALKRNAL